MRIRYKVTDETGRLLDASSYKIRTRAVMEEMKRFAIKSRSGMNVSVTEVEKEDVLETAPLLAYRTGRAIAIKDRVKVAASIRKAVQLTSKILQPIIFLLL